MARKMNPSGGQIALAAGAAIIAGLAVKDVFAKKKKKKAKEEENKPIEDEEKRIADELVDLISEDPGPGKLYQIRSGNNFNNIARDVFSAANIPDARENGQARVAYMQCVSASTYNKTLFGTQGDFTDSFPSYTSGDGMSLRSAFLNKSADYISQLLNGHLPVRTSGGRLGLIWLPSIDTAAWQQFNKIICTETDPPPLSQ